MDDYERPPLPEEPPVFEEPPAKPAPAKKATAAPTAANGPDPNWQPFMDTAKSIISPAVFGLLHQCSGSFTDGGMVIYAPPFPYGQLNTPANLQRLKQAANAFYGHSVELKLESADANAPRPAARSLDEIKKFSDIVKFK